MFDEAKSLFEMVEEKNVKFIYTFGSTIDEKYKLEKKDIISIAYELLELARSARPLQNFGLTGESRDKGLEERLNANISKLNSGKDSETQIFDEGLFLSFEKMIMDYFNRHGIVPEFQKSLGSGATYSYSASSKLFEHYPNKNAHFIGTMPFTVLQFLEQNKKDLGEEFIRNFREYATLHNEYNSRTIALEVSQGTQKFMISSAKGRSPEELNMGAFRDNVDSLYSNTDADLYVVQLGSLNKGDARFHREIKSVFEGKNGKNTVYYSGTSDFKGDNEKVIDVLRVVYPSEILSMNENELDQIYNALKHENTKATRADKLKELDNLVSKFNALNQERKIEINPHQIKICHSAYGAIAYKNDNKDISLIQDLLQLSVDATSSMYETGEYHNMNEIMSKNIHQRYKDSHFNEFTGKKPDELKKEGLAVALAPEVSFPIGSLTGLGAVFDGIASSIIGFYFVK